MNSAIVENFWSNVDKTDTCWNWTGPKNNGYPIVNINGHYSARKISLELANKAVSKVTKSTCGNMLCVNPDHLVSGNEARFWSKIHQLNELNGGCWVWIGENDHQGYAKLAIAKDGRSIRIKASHYSWEMYTGRTVPKGIQICHTCDHPWCVNPHHLFLGTAKDNAQDKVIKGRHPVGEQCSYSRLNEQLVREMRELRRQGKEIKEIAKIYNFNKGTVQSAISGKSWKHVT